MQAISSFEGQCPYCGESITMLIEAIDEAQQYIEDCEVCCRPITVSVNEMGEAQFQHENEV